MSEICPIMITVQLLFTLSTLQLPKPKVQPHLRANVGRQIKDGGAITCPVRESPFEPSLMPLKRGKLKSLSRFTTFQTQLTLHSSPHIGDREKNNCSHTHTHTFLCWVCVC